MAADSQNIDRIIGIVKFLIGTAGLGIISTYINGQIQEREVQIKERAQSQENLSRYIELAIDKDLNKRRDLAKYFKHLSRTEDERERWGEYLSVVNEDIDKNKEQQEKKKAEAVELKLQAEKLTEQLLRVDESEDREKVTAELIYTQEQLSQAKSDIAQLRQELKAEPVALEGKKELLSLVRDMDSPIKQERLNATGGLIAEHNQSPQAVSLALDMLTEPYLNELSMNGRVNVIVFLSATKPSAWTPALLNRLSEILAHFESRHRKGIAQIGPTTRDRIDKLKAHISKIKPIIEVER